MFTYPNLKSAKVKAIEQRCYQCNKWFKLPSETVKELQTDWVKRGQVPMRSCVCTHCKTDQIAPRIGKYDKPNTPKAKCAVQFVTTD